MERPIRRKHRSSTAMSASPISAAALDQLFLSARTHREWAPTPLTDDELRAVYDLLRFAPTAGNSVPGRFVFVRSAEAKERLLPAVFAGNVERVRSAPVTVLVAEDRRFFEHFPKVAPKWDAARFVTDPASAEAVAFRNTTLQVAYLILAARALGLDCGPMQGFDNAKVDAEFFPDGRWRSNLLVNLGHGAAAPLPPRAQRLAFEEACQLL